MKKGYRVEIGSTPTSIKEVTITHRNLGHTGTDGSWVNARIVYKEDNEWHELTDGGAALVFDDKQKALDWAKHVDEIKNKDKDINHEKDS